MTLHNIINTCGRDRFVIASITAGVLCYLLGAMTVYAFLPG